jgi:hypothetical protein
LGGFEGSLLYIYFVSSTTTTDFDGIVIVKTPSLKVKPVKAAGLTVSGFSKLLYEFISLAVSISPVTFRYESPITGQLIVICLLGLRFASEICTLPSLSTDAEADIAGIFLLPKV